MKAKAFRCAWFYLKIAQIQFYAYLLFPPQFFFIFFGRDDELAVFYACFMKWFAGATAGAGVMNVERSWRCDALLVKITSVQGI